MKLLLTCLVLTFSNLVNGQYIYVGTGTTNTLYGPAYIGSSTSYDKYSWNLSIYDQNEISAAGGHSGPIAMVAWYKVDTCTYPTWDARFQIYLKHTPLIEFVTPANFDIEVVNATLVEDFHNMAWPSPGVGWMPFFGVTAFNWNGIDNIMILTKWSRPGNATGTFFWQSTNTSPLTRVSYSYNSGPQMGPLYTSVNRPNIQLYFYPNTNVNNGLINNKSIISPNPAGDFIVISENHFESDITITDITGKKIIKSHIPQGIFQKINTSELVNGIYEVILSSKEKIIREKLIIAK